MLFSSYIQVRSAVSLWCCSFVRLLLYWVFMLWVLVHPKHSISFLSNTLCFSIRSSPCHISRRVFCALLLLQWWKVHSFHTMHWGPLSLWHYVVRGLFFFCSFFFFLFCFFSHFNVRWEHNEAQSHDGSQPNNKTHLNARHSHTHTHTYTDTYTRTHTRLEPYYKQDIC